MMAIVGEPSADGLVMEPLELQFGPLATPLPGGLLAAVTLDGDVVAECEVSALLEAETTDAAPDPMAPQAWQAVLDGAGEAAGGIAVPPSERWNRAARIEVERALSHMAWLRTFARALGWQGLVDRATHCISATLEAQDLSEPALREAANVVAETARFLEGSRLLRLRTVGRAPVDREPARVLGLQGPVARASGVVVDARLDDPLYRILGFEPVIGSEGDAHARTLVRAAEALQSIELAARARAKERSSDLGDALPEPAPLRVVEGPRGPLQARIDGSRRRLAVPGHEAALDAAGRAVVGVEWSAAVVGLCSFDLSPWRVSG
jgi:NADH:ubiquinone oxidoreductase subunit D